MRRLIPLLAMICLAPSAARAVNNVLVADGDSITLGTTCVGSICSAPYLNYLNLNGWTATNLGVNGETLATMLANAPTHVDPLFNAAAARNIVVIWGGTNDFAISGATVATTYSNLQSYCAGRRSAGFKVIVVGMINRAGNNPVGGEPLQTDMTNYNALIRANWTTFADGFADPATTANYTINSAYSDSTYYVDAPSGVHPTILGVQTELAPIIAAAIPIGLNNPPVFVSNNRNTTAGTPATSLSVVQTVQSKGDLIFLFTTGDTATSVSDQLGENFTPMSSTSNYSNVWWITASGTITLTITAHYSSSTFIHIYSADYGVTPGYTGKADSLVVTSIASPTTAVSAPYTINHPNSLAVMFGSEYGQGNASYTSNDALVMRYNGGDNSYDFVSGDKVTSVSGTETGTMNGTNAFGIYIGMVDAFQVPSIIQRRR